MCGKTGRRAIKHDLWICHLTSCNSSSSNSPVSAQYSNSICKSEGKRNLIIGLIIQKILCQLVYIPCTYWVSDWVLISAQASAIYQIHPLFINISLIWVVYQAIPKYPYRSLALATILTKKLYVLEIGK
jgi:hypothetical protein